MFEAPKLYQLAYLKTAGKGISIYSALSIANYFIGKSPQTATRLQKLIYLAHGWHLAIKNKPLVDERFEVKPYGPELRSVKAHYKFYGASLISDLSFSRSGARVERLHQQVESRHPPPDDFGTLWVLDQVYEQYHSLTTIQLANLTHFIGSPWEDAIKQNQKYIADYSIKESFKSLGS